MKHHGLFVPQSAIDSRVQSKDNSVARETAMRERATFWRVHGWTIAAMQACSPDTAYIYGKLLAHIAPKEG